MDKYLKNTKQEALFILIFSIYINYIKNTDYILEEPIYKNKLFKRCSEQNCVNNEINKLFAMDHAFKNIYENLYII